MMVCWPRPTTTPPEVFRKAKKSRTSGGGEGVMARNHTNEAWDSSSGSLNKLGERGKTRVIRQTGKEKSEQGVRKGRSSAQL